MIRIAILLAKSFNSQYFDPTDFAVGMAIGLQQDSETHETATFSLSSRMKKLAQMVKFFIFLKSYESDLPIQKDFCYLKIF